MSTLWLGPTPLPKHLLGSHTVLGISVPGGVNFALFMALSFPVNPLILNTYPLLILNPNPYKFLNKKLPTTAWDQRRTKFLSC